MGFNGKEIEKTFKIAMFTGERISKIQGENTNYT